MVKEDYSEVLNYFKEDIGKTEIRIFRFASQENRNMYSVLEFKDKILDSYNECVGNRVKVTVFPHCYVVVGEISATELRMVGKKICHYSRAGELCKRYGKSTQLFRCAYIVRVGEKR